MELALLVRRSILNLVTKGDLIADICEYIHGHRGGNLEGALTVLLGDKKRMDEKAAKIRSIFDTEREEARGQQPVLIVFRDNIFNIENMTLYQPPKDVDGSSDIEDL